MKHLIYSFTTMLIFSILPIKAQSYETHNRLKLETTWDPFGKRDNKDLNAVFYAYQSNQSITIVQDYPILDHYYIVDKKGIIILDGNIAFSENSTIFYIPLKGLRKDKYTLYLCVGTKLWYTTFSLN